MTPVSSHSSSGFDPGTMPAPAKRVISELSPALPRRTRADRIATQSSLESAEMYPTGPA